MTFDPQPTPTPSPSQSSPQPPGDAVSDDREPVRSGSKFRTIYSLLAVVCFATIAETLLKLGANATAASVSTAVSTGFSALASWYTIVGIVFHILAFAAWLYTLRTVQLSLAFNFTMAQQVTVSLSAWVVLHETMTPLRWVGLIFVIGGVLLLVPAIVNAEHRAERGAGNGGES